MGWGWGVSYIDYKLLQYMNFKNYWIAKKLINKNAHTFKAFASKEIFMLNIVLR